MKGGLESSHVICIVIVVLLIFFAFLILPRMRCKETFGDARSRSNRAKKKGADMTNTSPSAKVFTGEMV